MRRLSCRIKDELAVVLEGVEGASPVAGMYWEHQLAQAQYYPVARSLPGKRPAGVDQQGPGEADAQGEIEKVQRRTPGREWPLSCQGKMQEARAGEQAWTAMPNFLDPE